jgi:hypothetical protein
VASAEIACLLKFTHLCDVVDGGTDFKFRIVGHSAFPNMGSLAGKFACQHSDKGAFYCFPIFMREVVKTREPVRGMALRETEHGSYRFESIWLPFRIGDVQQVLGLMAVVTEEDGRALHDVERH